uniref:Uncharacterized protein n=1 Tax=Setaria italica TaxID=4555 RepID=K3ZG00_SETIT
MWGCIIKFYHMISGLVSMKSLPLLINFWNISDMLAVIQVKFHAEAQSLKDELEPSNWRRQIVSMPQTGRG